MSSLIVPIAEVESVCSHPNADRLEIAQIGGWQVCVGKGTMAAGQKVIYVAPDTVVTGHLADEWGVVDYLHSVPDSYPKYSGRVKAIKLRGEPSYGFAVPYTGGLGIGENVADYYGLLKYEPPAPKAEGGHNNTAPGVPIHPLFQGYTNIENYRHYPNVIQPDEMVVISEKLHGTNTRIAMLDGELCVGSHKRQWGKPDDDKIASNWFWYPTTIPGVTSFLEMMGFQGHKQVIIYGETYGNVQSLHYGHPNDLQWAAFDILVDGHYLDHDNFALACETFSIPTVPIFYRGEFNRDLLGLYSYGNTSIPDDTHMKEGVVIKPIVERHDPRIGRVILKYLSDDYLTSRHKDQEVAG